MSERTSGVRHLAAVPSARDRWREKIVDFDDLPKIRARFTDRRIVHCHGAFDLVHPGHLIHFEEARSLGDLLVVTVTGDRHITKKRSLTFPEALRAEQVAAIELVDYVAIVQEPTALSAIEALRPDTYVKGPEYADLTLDKSRSIYHEMRVLGQYGGQIRFTAGETFSSTKLAHFLLAAPDGAQRDPLLQNDQVRFRDISALGFSLDQLKQFVAKASPVRACVVGETIIDEWVDLSLTNLSTQSRCVAGVESARARQVGGVGAIARHLAGFVAEVHCFSNGTHPDAPSNVRHTAMVDGDLIETRFVDAGTTRTVFKSRNVGLGPARSCGLPSFDDYDLVLIADFGHGLLDASEVNRHIASRRHATVCVMAQVNSGNYGYNLPLKYTGADYYSLNRTEAELCLHERDLPLPQLLARTADRLGGHSMSVTDGDKGAFVSHGGSTFEMPSLSTSCVDTIGCGDAYFALSAVAIRLNLSARLVALVGSIAAAAVAQRRCNESAVGEAEFMTIGKIVI